MIVCRCVLLCSEPQKDTHRRSEMENVPVWKLNPINPSYRKEGRKEGWMGIPAPSCNRVDYLYRKESRPWK